MSDALPSLTDALKPAPKRRGRKPGGGKVPGSGRKPGVKNKVSHDMKTVILTRGKPLELLCDISRGVKVRVGPQAGPGEPQYAYPSLQERAAAAKILLDKLMPAAAVSKLDDEGTDADATDISTIEIGRRIAYALSTADRELAKRNPTLEPGDEVLDLKATEPENWYNAPQREAAPPPAPEPVPRLVFDQGAFVTPEEAEERALQRRIMSQSNPRPSVIMRKR